ncbi:nicotinate-nucleotide diphosphorylase (carboxylating), partial [Bacillus wiedmannii]
MCDEGKRGFMNTIKVKEALNRFFLEDIGERDVTS